MHCLQDLGDPDEVARVGAQVLQGVSEADLLEGLKSDEAKRLQRDGVQQSIAAGVWGIKSWHRGLYINIAATHTCLIIARLLAHLHGDWDSSSYSGTIRTVIITHF